MAGKPTREPLGFAPLLLPVFLHSGHSTAVVFREGTFVAFFSRLFLCLLNEEAWTSATLRSPWGLLLAGCKYCSGSRERTLLKRFPVRPRRTKLLSSSLRILFTLCSCLLWIFNARPLFIAKGFRQSALPGRWAAWGGSRGCGEGKGKDGSW